MHQAINTMSIGQQETPAILLKAREEGAQGETRRAKERAEP